MEKRLFQILDDMNVHDTEHETRLVAVSNHFISGDKVKQGAKICMGVPESVLLDIMEGKVIPVFMAVDKAEYNKRKEGSEG